MVNSWELCSLPCGLRPWACLWQGGCARCFASLQVSLEAHSAVRVFPAYAGRPKSFTGFPRAVLWTGTVLLTIAHNLFATAFINSPFFKGNVLAVTRSFHHPQMVITEDMFPQGTGSDGAHCPAPLDEAP
jgi:hypothetical protein